mgnify:CR=1 FL=1
MNKGNLSIQSQSGQAITEAVLILVLLMGFTLLVGRFLKDEEVLKRLIQSPFQSLAGMLQNGAWAPAKASVAIHPNMDGRHISLQGEFAQ